MNKVSDPDISVIITAHREGLVAGPTLCSVRDAIDHITYTLSKSAEIVVVLDRADRTTRSIFRDSVIPISRIIETDEGDPGQARNRGVDIARGRYVTFIDGDDLWSFNWLTEAYKLLERRSGIIAHSNCDVVFGHAKNVWWHIDSEGALFDPRYLQWANYWDALSFGNIDIYRRFPFKANDLEAGFGHEDWHWNWLTITAGVPHKPVPGTVHYKRRRRNSVSVKVEEMFGTAWPVESPSGGLVSKELASPRKSPL